MLKVGTILHGTYRIDSYLSSGGFGNTYVATNIEFDERVAIKEFFMRGVTQRDENQTTVSVSNSENTNSFFEQREKFKKEARRIRQLHNEHIVAVHDLFEENGTAYYVMDFVDGENLAERLKRTGRPMTESEVNLILPKILDALKAVHDAGFCHLDIKPSNIMLEKGGKVKLIDFGASKQLGANGTLTTNAPTAFAQTPGYAPREQIEQSLSKIGPWTDIYALGATLYTLLTNKRPPLPSDIDDDLSEDKHIALPFPESIGETKFLVLQLMKTNRLQRPQNIDAIKVADKQKLSPISGSHNAKNKNWVEAPWSTDEESEETILADSKTKKEYLGAANNVKNGQAQRTQRESVSTIETSEDENTKFPLIFKILIGCFVCILFWFMIPKGNVIEDNSPQESNISVVERMNYETPIGGCQYSGPVDEQNRPNGFGEAFFYDGRYYKGNIEHGEFTGDDCYFKYANGDEFRGKFRNNSFYYGKYTIAKDQSYYVGSYKNGQPDAGSWYDKNGRIIE